MDTCDLLPDRIIVLKRSIQASSSAPSGTGNNNMAGQREEKGEDGGVGADGRGDNDGSLPSPRFEEQVHAIVQNASKKGVEIITLSLDLPTIPFYGLLRQAIDPFALFLLSSLSSVFSIVRLGSGELTTACRKHYFTINHRTR